jgi:hypothetical protein
MPGIETRKITCKAVWVMGTHILLISCSTVTIVVEPSKPVLWLYISKTQLSLSLC